MIFETVQDIICKQLNISKDEVLENTLIAEDLQADSLDIVDLIMAIEEEFGISITDDVANEIVTVDDIVTYLVAQELPE